VYNATNLLYQTNFTLICLHCIKTYTTPPMSEYLWIKVELMRLNRITYFGTKKIPYTFPSIILG